MTTDLTTDKATETPNQPAPDPAPKKKTRKITKVILAVSLTLNLLVLGLVAGAHLRDGSDDRRFPPSERSAMRDMGFSPFIGALPREHKRAIGKTLRDRSGSFVANRQALAQEMADIIAILRAQPFDPAVLDGVLQAQGARIRGRAETGRDILVEQIGKMTQSDRAEYADKLEHGLHRAMERARR